MDKKFKFECNVGIYCYKNLLNGKAYVGQSGKLSRRINEHELNFKRININTLNAGENKNLWRDVRKFGRDNFLFSIIQHCNENELDDLEKKYIKELNAHVSLGGYNVSWSSHSFMRGVKMSETTKANMSKNRMGKSNNFYGKKHTEETRKKISTWRSENKDIWYVKGTKHHNFGRKHTDKTKEKFSEIRMGEKNSMFGKKHTNSASKFHGVHLDKHKEKYIYWVAKIDYKTKRTYIGSYKSEIDAAKAYDEFVISHNLPHILNFKR